MSDLLQGASDAITETIAHPNTAVPVTVGVSVASWMHSLPDIINIATVIYLALLIINKAWNMYKEWKTGKMNDG